MGLWEEIYKDIKSILGWVIGILVILIIVFPGILILIIAALVLLLSLASIRKKFHCSFGEAVFLWFLGLLRIGLFLSYFLGLYLIFYFFANISDLSEDYGLAGIFGIPLSILSAFPIIIALRYFVLELLRLAQDENYIAFNDDKKQLGHFTSFCIFQFLLFTFILIGINSLVALRNSGVLNIFYGISIILGGIGFCFFNSWIEDFVEVDFTNLGEFFIKLIFYLGAILLLFGIVMFIRGIILAI